MHLVSTRLEFCPAQKVWSSPIIVRHSEALKLVLIISKQICLHYLLCSLVHDCSPPIRYIDTATPLAGRPTEVSRMWDETGSGGDLFLGIRLIVQVGLGGSIVCRLRRQEFNWGSNLIHLVSGVLTISAFPSAVHLKLILMLNVVMQKVDSFGLNQEAD